MTRGNSKVGGGRRHGMVVRLFPDRGYGFLRDALSEQEFFFHVSAVVGKQRTFGKMVLGTEVEFTPYKDLGRDGEESALRVEVQSA